MRRTGLLLLPLLLAAPAAAMDAGPPPPEYGRVLMARGTRKAGVPAVGFDHWRHRVRYTCRLCHVDVGFAMAAGQTGVTAATNQAGFHCGACHDGKRLHHGKPLFAACAPGVALDDPGAPCRRCHAPMDRARLEADYARLAGGLPRDHAGGIDWERAEAEGMLKPIDELAGLSVARRPLPMKKEVTIASRAAWMQDILFSHPKHSVWNGCEVCHPDIFPAGRGAGPARYSMLQVSAGEYCGVCHGKVAFGLADCGRCHRKPMR